MVQWACANCQHCLVEGSLCLMFAKNTFAQLTVFEPGLEEQPLSKCVVLNSLLRCVSIANRADKKSPTKVDFDIYVFRVPYALNHKGKG